MGPGLPWLACPRGFEWMKEKESGLAKGMSVNVRGPLFAPAQTLEPSRSNRVT